MRHASKQRITVLAVASSVMLVASVAFAAWLSTGSGSGSAKSTVAENSTIAAAASAADLFPGATKSVTVTIDNTNDYPVIVTNISAGTSDAVASTTCAANSVTSDAKSNATGLMQSDGTTLKIPANSSGTYSLVTHMIANPDNACQNKTFNLPLTAALESAA